SFAGTIDNVTVMQLTTAHAVPNAPAQNATMLVTPERIVLTGGSIEASTGTFNPLHIRWSDQENNQDWTAAATNQAGFITLAKGARVVGMRSGRGEILIWTDEGLHVARYVPDPNVVYSFTHVASGCGLIGPNAVVVVNGSAYWMSSGGAFFRYSGGVPETLQSTVRRDVFDHISSVQHDKIYAFAVSSYGEIWWLYPDARDGNECSRYVLFNTRDDTWSSGTFDRTAWADASALAFPLAVAADGGIYFHEKGASSDGGPLAWRLASAAIDIGDGDKLMRIAGLVPDFEDMTGGATINIDTRLYPSSPPQTIGPFDISADSTRVDIRAVGRQASIRIAGESAPAFARLGALRLDIQQTGMRR
ncbi:MAG: hypothetical protein RLN70_07780, partial [Rhodospirillaceae bacterium]